MVKQKELPLVSLNTMNEVHFEGDIVPWLDQHIKAMDTPLADYLVQRCNIS